ncbi:unnamed protein product [Closterium sp. Yama58-4]|nr:unnamed protein product [Closterium sp. Yama58-4]
MQKLKDPLPAARGGLRLGKAAQPADCCNKCREQANCSYWNYFVDTGLCYLYTASLCSSDNSAEIKRTVYTPKDPKSYVGGRCNGDAPKKDKNLPAISSSLQTSLPERSFCLFSDPELHINMRLGGYLDRRTTLANPANQPTPRVWIRELGFVWQAPAAGEESTGKGGKDRPVHTVRFVSRRGPQEARGDGYLAALEVDGTLVPRLMLGDELSLFDGQAIVTMDAHEKSGPGSADVDKYTIRIEGLLEAEIRHFLPSAREMRRRFTISDIIGEGTSGRIWRCFDRTSGSPYACKEILKSGLTSFEIEGVYNEVTTMCLLSAHKNVLSLHEAYEDDDAFYLMTDLCTRGDLFDLIAETNGLDEPTARHIFLQIARGLRWCHHFDVAHRDIKPENIMLTSPVALKSVPRSALTTQHQQATPISNPRTTPSESGDKHLESNCGLEDIEVRIGDFGLAQQIREGEELRNVVGSYPYEAPEVLACQGHDLKADVWSLGVVLYMMVCADWPAFPNNHRELLPVDFAVSPWPSVSKNLRDLVRRMMEVDPTKRLSIDGVLSHPWLVSANGGTKARNSCIMERLLPSAFEMRKRFTFFDIIGEGNSGLVGRCYDRISGSLHACKEIFKSRLSPCEIKGVYNEVAMMRLLSGHKNVLSLYKAYEDDNTFYLITNLCTRGDLFDLIAGTKGLDELTARHIFLQIARGLRWCHRFNVAHRDIKPENILLTSTKALKSSPRTQYEQATTISSFRTASGSQDTYRLESNCGLADIEVRIGDFGLAQQIRDGENLTGAVGSRPYEAPEVIACQEHDLTADVWSLGVLLPVDFAVSPWPSVSSSLKDLVRRMMEVDPTKRLSIDGVLSHPWIVSARGSTRAVSLGVLSPGSMKGTRNCEESEYSFLASSLNALYGCTPPSPLTADKRCHTPTSVLGGVGTKCFEQ